MAGFLNWLQLSFSSVCGCVLIEDFDRCALFGIKVKMGDEQRRRFVRIPVETMQTYVDRMDLRVSGDTAAALAEDVSFRIRQIADVRSGKQICLIKVWGSHLKG